MTTIKHNYPLEHLNTFRVAVKTKQFVNINSEIALVQLIKEQSVDFSSIYLLGDGSNTLFTKDFPGTVLKIGIPGIEIISETNTHTTIRVGAGENWHHLVMWSVDRNLSGIENLAYIPGTVGAAPVQNLAAYGQTFEDVFIEAAAIDLVVGKPVLLGKDECGLAYRTSRFKHEWRGKYVITAVTIQLAKMPEYDTSYHGRFGYESLASYLAQIKSPPYTPKDVAQAVINQRKEKLPEVSEYGTCGSFFVNPFISIKKFHELEQELADLQQYPITKMEYNRLDWHDTGQDEIIKIPAGRLLDELGWKGKWIGNVGTFDKHALIVVTNGHASGDEILSFTDQMKQSVQNTYGIDLISEVNIV